MSTEQLPPRGRVCLAADLDGYVSSEDMLEIVQRASLERYVEFSCVLRVEDSFDEALELNCSLGV